MFELPGAVMFGSASGNAARELMSQGIALPGKPAGLFPDLAGEDITEMDDPQLMYFFGKFREWCDFYDLQLAAAQVDETVALSAGLSGASNEKNVTLTKARAELDPTYQQAMAYRKLIESQAKRADRGYYHCSRELSRRTQPRRPEKPRSYGWGDNGRGHLAD